MSPPPPHRGRHPPPSLVDDAMRVPPHDPASLLPRLRGIISDPAFCLDYRAFHCAPTTAFRPPGPNPRCRNWYAIEFRHGRVLLYAPHEKPVEFIVWDPITDGQCRIPTDPKYPDINWNAAVLCAKDGCDHLSCHVGPFLVAFVASDDQEGITFASVYSSEAGEWSDTVVI